MNSTSPFLIAGIGNWLLTDDGVGIHAVRELEQQPIPGVWMVDFGTAILHALAHLESAERVLLIDAVKGGRPPGTIYFFEATGNRETSAPFSIHSLGWREALRFLSPGKTPPAITVLGVEPASLAYGIELSPTVRAVLPELLSLARKTVSEWLAERPLNRTLTPHSELSPA